MGLHLDRLEVDDTMMNTFSLNTLSTRPLITLVAALTTLTLFAAPVAGFDTLWSENRIILRTVGGTDTRISNYPWQVALMTSSNFQFCGGSILAERWVVTAAHCYTRRLSHIRAGVTNKASTTGQDIPVAKQIQHPSYDPWTSDNDIMLLELSRSLDLSSANAKPIAWMTPKAAARGLQNPGTKAAITGWGNLYEGGTDSDILQEAIVPIVSNAQARQAYDPIFGPDSVTPQMLAAGFLQGGVDSCQGDSGGPLVVRDAATEQGFRLAGITSWGLGCARPNFPGIYTRVSMFTNWIADYVSGPTPQPTSLCTECIPSRGGWRSTLQP